jgi:hypothetical protein
MPVHESEAIILQSYPLGEADRLVSFLSRSMGRVRGVASGARRIKSRFGSTLERLSHVHIWFYEKQNRELVRINQCDLVESFLDAFGDYGSGVALAILSEVTETVLPDHEPSDANCAVDREAGWLAAGAGCLRALRAQTGVQGSGVLLPERFGDFVQQVPSAGDAHAFSCGTRCSAENARRAPR